MSEDRLEWAAIPADVLHIPATLASGQAFRWRREEDGGWKGVVGQTAVILYPERDGFRWQTYPEHRQWSLLEHYFALDVELPPLYARWIAAVPEMETVCECYRGLRILRQDASETLFSFLCASCNTIVKIRRTTEALSRRYGEPIAEIRGETYFAFPTINVLAGADERALRDDRWGFRARRVIQAAEFLMNRPPDWLERLRKAPRKEATQSLESLFGIGAKIADCIALFGLWHDDAVPIDTHVRQIAMRIFRPEVGARTLTPSVYRQLGDLYRERFGEYAGWAQQYLFLDELTPGTKLGVVETY